METEQRPPFVVFSTPCLSKWVSIEYHLAAMATQYECQSASINQVWRILGGDPYLHKVRSKLATEFLGFTEATHLFFLDDDVGWPAEKVVQFLRRPEDIIVGAYPMKQETSAFPIEIEGDGTGRPQFRDGLVLTRLAPTGFMCIRRHVIERMAAESGEYIDPDAERGEVAVRDIFRCGYIESSDVPGKGKFWGEDFFFSSRARAMGYEIWCDPDISFTHRGGKAWGGNLRHAMEGVGMWPAPAPDLSIAS